MSNYEITQKTLALVPLGKTKTIVYENHDCYIVESKLSKIMDDNCKYYGSSIEGRIKGTYSLTGFNYKSPIIIAEDKNLIFFPTCSPRLKECSWINVNNINKILKKPDGSIIEFINKEILEFDVSYNIINNQFLKSLNIETKFNKRKIN